MYGGSGKLGRGGGGAGRGGGVGKRNIQSPFQPPPFHRGSPSPAGRLPVGSGASAPRNRNMTSGPTSSAPSNGVEETFSLVTGNRLNYAMIIRLAPDLVEEIKRLETEGGAARIKFDANANSDGNDTTSNARENMGDCKQTFVYFRLKLCHGNGRKKVVLIFSSSSRHEGIKWLISFVWASS